MSKARTIGTVNKIESNLNARLETDFWTVQTVTDQTRDSVLASLNPSRNFLIDSSVSSKIDQIINLFSTRKSDLEAYRNRLIQERSATIGEIWNITTTYWMAPTNVTIANRLINAQTKETDLGLKIGQLNNSITEIETNRLLEYEALKIELDKLDVTRDLPDMKWTTYNASADLMKPGMTAVWYSFYDKDGVEINGWSHPANYFVDVKLADGSIQNLRVTNLQISTTWNIDISTVVFYDRAGAPVTINQAYEFSVNPWAIVTLPGIGWTNNFIHSKPLKIVRPDPTALTSANRLTQLTNYNAVSNSVSNAMTAIYDTEIKGIEKQAFFDGLKHADGPKFDKLTDAQKEDLYNRVRNEYMSWWIPNPALARANTNLNTINNYNTWTLGFATWITSDDHPFSKDKEINKDTNARRNNLSNELENQIQAYFKNRFDAAFTKHADGNTFLKAHLTEYLTELKENTKETTTWHMDSALDLAVIKMNTKGSKFNIFSRKDNNYMKFLTGKSIDIPEQTLQLKKEVKYSMRLEVSPKHQLISKIKINNKEVGIKGKDPMDLMQNILKNPAIKEGETRMHIAYNVMTWLIQMVNKENISLSSPVGTNSTMKMDGKDIVLETLDPTTRLTKVDKIFDYSLFDATKSWTDPNMSWRSVPTPNIRTLRMGIDATTKHFNACMNKLNDNFNDALEKNIVPKFPTSRGMSPIKKLLNHKNVMNFDFETSLTENGKNITISRTKNIFTLKIDDIEVKWRDLGKLLTTRRKGIRIFDGVERAVCGEVYKTLVEKLRENTKIANSNFWVIDPISQKMYILDEDGQLWYIIPQDVLAEKWNLRNTPTVWTIAAGVGVWAFAWAFVWSLPLASGLTWTALKQAWLLTGAALTGTNFASGLIGIANKEYWVLPHSPAARTMCDESETKEVYRNPLLMGRLMKTMNLRLGQI